MVSVVKYLHINMHMQDIAGRISQSHNLVMCIKHKGMYFL